VIYQAPLAYLLGLEGVALLRAFAGEYDRDFCETRIAEIRRLLRSPSMNGEGITAGRVDTVDGYRVWSQTYDRPGNGLFAYEEPVVHDILEPLPPGTALDAACGTGRQTEYLAARGHRVIGVDSCPDMLDYARARVPHAEFQQGDLHQLPLPDDHVDIVVCALALSHLPDQRPSRPGQRRPHRLDPGRPYAGCHRGPPQQTRLRIQHQASDHSRLVLNPHRVRHIADHHDPGDPGTVHTGSLSGAPPPTASGVTRSAQPRTPQGAR
jgi:SAM-dependent methyltransferase